MHWINQVAGNGLKYMGWINANTGSTGYAEGFKGQFVFSVVPLSAPHICRPTAFRPRTQHFITLQKTQCDNHILGVLENLRRSCFHHPEIVTGMIPCRLHMNVG
jgi:hypothetical protein